MSTFCKDCTHRSGSFGYSECEKTRRHYVDGVTGKPWSAATSCGYARTGTDTCRNFEKIPTFWERVKECFQ